MIIWTKGVVEAHMKWKPENIWTSERLPFICIELLKEFEADHPISVAVEEAYKLLTSYSGNPLRAKPFPSRWPYDTKAHKAYYNSDGESPGSKKKKRKFKEARARHSSALRDKPEEDPDLFGDKAASKAHKTN